MSTVTGDETKFEGDSGWSEIVPIPPEARNAEHNISAWLLFAPSAHPMWSFHLMYAVDLKPHVGFSANLAFPEATHEIGVLALNPESQPYTVEDLQRIVSAELGSIPYLEPPDAVVQVSATDEQVRLLAIYAARAVAHGQLVPDSDYASSWSESLRDKLQHLQTGGHDT
jgi:hypothetical protein